jgi:hypothetical protein
MTATILRVFIDSYSAMRLHCRRHRDKLFNAHMPARKFGRDRAKEVYFSGSNRA